MPKRKQRAIEAVDQRPVAAKSCLYLGCFTFDEPAETDHEGSFQVVVEAATPEQAVERFRARLDHLRREGTLFSEPTTIYLNGIVELRGSYAKGLLINYEQGPSPAEPCVRLMCMLPEQSNEGTGVYGWGEDPDSSVDERGVKVEPFVDFGGEAARSARIRRNDAALQWPRAPEDPAGSTWPGGHWRTTHDPAQHKTTARARCAALAATAAELDGRRSQ